jgi:hypothetical protein
VSAVPKHENPAFWTEARVVELPIPDTREIPLPGMRRESSTHRTTQTQVLPRQVPLPHPGYILRFERAICFAMIVFALMSLSVVSHQALVNNIQARDARLSIQEARRDLSLMREELQRARENLETFSAPEGAHTMPVEPGDVATVMLPPAR